MLVAGPSHSSYVFTGNSVPSRESSTKSHGSSSSSNKYSLIKSFAEQFNRGTDLLSQTVQKVIFSKISSNATSTITTTTSSSVGQLNITNNNDRNDETTSIEQLTYPKKLKPLILYPGKFHRSLSIDSDSGDSLKLEMCHFKPIRTMPTTPKRKNVNTRLKFPKPQKKTINVNICNLATPKSTYKPLQNRYSAFRSIKLIEEPNNVTEGPSLVTTTANIKTTKATKPVAKKRGNKRKLKTSDICPVPLRKSCRTNNANNTTKTIKTTTTTTLLINKEQQEKDDYEYAKKLQEELNNRDCKTAMYRGYSLRRKNVIVNNTSIVNENKNIKQHGETVVVQEVPIVTVEKPPKTRRSKRTVSGNGVFVAPTTISSTPPLPAPVIQVVEDVEPVKQQKQPEIIIRRSLRRR